MRTPRPPYFWDPATPVHRDEETGAWHVFAYDDVLRVISERTFVSDFVPREELPHANPVMVGFWESDGDRHRDLRAAAAKQFRATLMTGLCDEVAAVATDLIDAIDPERGPGELEVNAAGAA